MNKAIGIFHYKVGGTDGVSLELDKWKHVLEEMGHTVHLCGGDLGTAKGTLIEEMFHHRPDARRLNLNTFHQLRDYPDEAAYRAELFQLADRIERQISAFVESKEIDFLIPQNVWSVAISPSVAIALARVMREYQLPTLAHSHDFYWERTGGIALTCATAIELADKFLPPRDPLIRHAVINSLAQRELAERKGIQATVIPNVFDFDAPPLGGRCVQPGPARSHRVEGERRSHPASHADRRSQGDRTGNRSCQSPRHPSAASHPQGTGAIPRPPL
jgi:hypothetical protein